MSRIRAPFYIVRTIMHVHQTSLSNFAQAALFSSFLTVVLANNVYNLTISTFSHLLVHRPYASNSTRAINTSHYANE
jgi:hypothetical protein